MADSIRQVMAGAATVTPTTDPIQIQSPAKLKGRKRILQSLHRISSSPSLAKLGRTPSSGYRAGGRGSISCVSLSSSASYCHSYGNSYSSQSSGGFSTAPTSTVSTPGQDSPFFDPKARIRFIDLDAGQNGSASVPVPAELRPTSSRGAPLPSTPELSEVVDDYFSRPIAKTTKPQKSAKLNLWGDLPDELKMHVLGYLQPKELVRCSIVSKAWHKMCFDGQLWPSLDTTDFYRHIPGNSLAKIIMAAGPFVRDLNLRGCVQLRERVGTEAMSEACQNIINLSIEGCRLDRSEIHSFLVRNSRLAYLNVSGLAVVTNSTMKVLAQSCPRLEHLNVSWCNNVDTRGLRKIVESCPKLKDLRAGEVRGFGDHEFMQELFQKNTLERLILNHCDSITDESLKVLLEGVDAEIDPLTSRAIVPPRRLKHLDLTRCRGLTDDGIKALAGNVPDLEGFQVSKCAVLTDAAFAELLTSVPRLTHLDMEELDELTNSTLQVLARSPCMGTLEHLCISYCENLGDVGMLPVMKNCTRLRNVEMDNTRVSDLVLAEAASVIRQRNRIPASASQRRPVVGLRMVVYDCQNVTWTGIREVLSRNAEIKRPGVNSKSPSYPTEVIQLKCFYGWQMTVDEHMKRVLRGDLASAGRLERKWAEYMIANEEAGVGGAGSRRRRRRAREAAMLHADEEEGGMGFAGIGRRRRARSGGCTIM